MDDEFNERLEQHREIIKMSKIGILANFGFGSMFLFLYQTLDKFTALFIVFGFINIYTLYHHKNKLKEVENEAEN